MAPSTPPPDNRVELAAFALASTHCVVMLPTRTLMRPREKPSTSPNGPWQRPFCKRRLREMPLATQSGSLGSAQPTSTGFKVGESSSIPSDWKPCRHSPTWLGAIPVPAPVLKMNT